MQIIFIEEWLGKHVPLCEGCRAKFMRGEVDL